MLNTHKHKQCILVVGFKRTTSPAFALPTVLIASIVMLMVLMAAVTSTEATRSALLADYYNTLVSESSDAGVAYAKTCLASHDNIPQWSNAAPLTPSTDCTGTQLTGFSCPTNSVDPRCSVNLIGDIRTSFSVGLPTLDNTGRAVSINSLGKVDLLRASNNAPWRSYKQTSIASATATPYTDDSLPVGSSISGYWSTPPSGYLLEDGSAVSRTTYAALFASVGTTYGVGDGSTTFNLPDSRGRVSVNKSSADAEFNTMGEKYGGKTDTQTVAQLPNHTHIQNPHSETVPFELTTNEASGYALISPSTGFGNRAIVSGSSTATSSATATNQYTGGSQPHNIIQPSITKLSAIKYLAPRDTTVSSLPAGTSIDGYWSSATAPTGYLVEDGSAVSRTTYADLFAVISTTYGAGDGSTTFNLPDSRGRVGVDKNPSDAEFSTMGEKYGEKTHTMTINEMPSHTHIQNPHNESVSFYPSGNEASGYGIGAGNGFGDRVMVTGGSTSISSATATNQYTGSNQPENVIQPSITKLSVVKYTPVSTSATNTVGAGTSISGWWSSVPSGYLPEDGLAVSRTTYSKLFSIVGTTYGAGDGSTTFNLPDSRGRVGVDKSPTDAEFNTMGEKYGEKTHTMTINEMASHTHTQNPHNHIIYVETSGNEAAGYGLTIIGGFVNRVMVTNGSTSTSSATATNQYTGGGQPFNVIQLSITKLYAIKY